MQAYQNRTNPAFYAELELQGNCGYEIQNDRVAIHIDRIANNRAPGHCSGTLSVELWALTRPYGGGQFDGVAVAGTRIGELHGEHLLSDCRYDLPFQEPPAGTWHMTLMLREWSDAGYVTRDYVSFSVPYQVGATPVIPRTDNVINVSFPGAAKNAPTAPAPDEPAPAAVADGVSLNHASVSEIAGVKGISGKLAENIVASRPFASLDEVLKVKGMGEKLLRKVRDLLTL